MSVIAIRGLLRRRRRNLALLAAVLTAAAAITVHHSAMASSMDHGMGMGAVAQMCLGVVAAVGAAVVLVAIGVLALGAREPLLKFAPSALRATRLPIARARDGPSLLVLLCVCQR